jgi:hypothetical protein
MLSKIYPWEQFLNSIRILAIQPQLVTGYRPLEVYSRKVYAFISTTRKIYWSTRRWRWLLD